MLLIFCRAQLDEDVRVRLETASYDEMELEGGEVPRPQDYGREVTWTPHSAHQD